ncbi:MAG: amino acid permease [Sphingomonadales bacterium]|nr:amino acid permease [Sphingomonadales bacterium]
MQATGEGVARPFGIWTAASLVVGLMVGVGIYSLPAQLADFGWTGVLAWGIAGLGTLACAIPLVRLVAARPADPSLMVSCGEILGRPVGLMTCWSYWVSLWCANALVATVTVQYAASLVPGFRPQTLTVGLIGAVAIAASTLVNLAGLREAGRMQVVLTALKLLPLAAVLAMLAQLAATPQLRPGGLPLAPLRAGQVTPAVTMAFFALVGFECAALVAERVRDPARNIARATLLGMAGTTLVYLVISTGIAMALPRAQLAASTVPIEDFARVMWGPAAAAAVALFAAISGLGVINAQTLLLGELPLALARARQIPAWLAPANRRDVAAWPLLLGSLLSIALLLGSATTLGANLLAFLLKLTTAVTIFLYFAVCVAAFRLRLARGWAGLGALFCIGVLYGAGLDAGGLAIGLMLAGAPLYALALLLGPKVQPSLP